MILSKKIIIDTHIYNFILNVCLEKNDKKIGWINYILTHCRKTSLKKNNGIWTYFLIFLFGRFLIYNPVVILNEITVMKNQYYFKGFIHYQRQDGVRCFKKVRFFFKIKLFKITFAILQRICRNCWRFFNVLEYYYSI